MKQKHIHFVGIKGVGMTALALLAKEAGFIISGCDVAEVFITDDPLKKAGILPLIGFSDNHLHNVDLVITTGAHGGFTNPEVIIAKEKNIQVLTQGEAVGIFMQGEICGRNDIEGISVAGTHGKTTTTAMLATLLLKNNYDPSFVIGTASISSLGTSGRYGKGKYFVAEADEYATEPQFDKTPKFLWQHPKIAIITNIEHDHPDVYPTKEDVLRAFQSFITQLPQDGMLIACGDDEGVQAIIKETKMPVCTYGQGEGNTVQVSNIVIQNGKTTFSLIKNGAVMGTFTVGVSGVHNALNSAAAILAGGQCGLSVAKMQQALVHFVGSKRRAEYIGILSSGAAMYDDYAHHPTEIQKTLEAFKQSFPDKKILCIFQPHTYSRTKELFPLFIHAFDTADSLVLLDIYASRREVKDTRVSSAMLAEQIKKRKSEVYFLPTLTDVVEYIDKNNIGQETVIVTMGAGDVYKLAEMVDLQENI